MSDINFGEAMTVLAGTAGLFGLYHKLFIAPILTALKEMRDDHKELATEVKDVRIDHATLSTHMENLAKAINQLSAKLSEKENK